MTVLHRVKYLTKLLWLTTLLVGNPALIRAQTQDHLKTDIGRPRLRTLKRIHQLLLQKQQPEQEFRQKTLEEITQGEPGGLRLGLIGSLDIFGATGKNPTPRKRAVNLFDESAGQLLRKLNPELEREFSDGLVVFFQKDYEFIARKLSLLHAEAAPGEKIVILEFPRPDDPTRWEAARRPTRVQWTASALIAGGSAGHSSGTSVGAGRAGPPLSTGVRVHQQPQRMPARVIDLDPGRKALDERQSLEKLTAPKLGALAARDHERRPAVSVGRRLTETAVGFVGGPQEFGWTFGLLGETYVGHGFGDTYAALAVPVEATSLALTAKVCASSDGGKGARLSRATDAVRAELATESWDCGALKSFVINIPGDETPRPYKGARVGGEPRPVTEATGNSELSPGTPEKARSFYELGVKHNEEKHWGEAVEALRKAVRINPDYAEAHYKLGVALVNLGGYDAAVAAFEQAVRLKPDYTDAYHNLGQAYFKLGRYEGAVTAFEQYSKGAPQDADALLKLITAHFNLGNYRDAAAVARRVVEIKPESSPAYYALAHSLYRAGELEASVGAFRKYISLNPENDDGYAWLVRNLRDMGRWAEVVEVYDHQIRKKPYHARAGLIADRAFSKLILGKGEEAATDARFFIRLRGWRDHLSTHMALLAHFGYRLAGNETAAREILDEAATRSKDSEPGVYILIDGRDVYPLPNQVIRFMRGKLTMAILSRSLVEENSRGEERLIEGGSEAHLFIGWHLSLSGRLREALVHLKSAELNADKTSFFYVLGRNEAARVEEVLRSTLPPAEFAQLSKSVQDQLSIRPRERVAGDDSSVVVFDDLFVSEVVQAVLIGALNKGPATKRDGLFTKISVKGPFDSFAFRRWFTSTSRMLADSEARGAEALLRKRLDKLPTKDYMTITDEDDPDDSDGARGQVPGGRVEKRRPNVSSKFSLEGVIFSPVRVGQRATVVLYGADIPASVGVMIDGVALSKLEVGKSAETTATLSEPFIPAEVKNSDAPQAKPERAGPEGYFHHDPTFIILSFSMPRGYVGTPVITLVGPPGTEVINKLPLLVKDEGYEGLRAAQARGRRSRHRRLGALPVMFSPERTPRPRI